jgi:uncharacterized DUF497 family protein
MQVEFEWDDRKAETNRRKHGVTFREAATVLEDPRKLVKLDEEHSDAEDRWHVLGFSSRDRLLLVVTVDRTNRVRIISARKATPKETQSYVQSQNP